MSLCDVDAVTVTCHDVQGVPVTSVMAATPPAASSMAWPAVSPRGEGAFHPGVEVTLDGMDDLVPTSWRSGEDLGLGIVW